MRAVGRYAGKAVGRLPALLAAAACARIEPPPGGPPDAAPPNLVTVVPESLARLPDFDGEVEFRFDEVISEGGAPSQGRGTGDLEKLVILSPSERPPKVNWRRDRITVRPSEGWRPNRVYRVQLLPGVTDLRRNRATEGASVTFTTGAPVPTATLRGTVLDWSTGRGAAGALVEARLLPDSLSYRALADSAGRFELGPVPAGDYLVSGVLDQNRNLRADPREAYDTTRLTGGKLDAGELWVFVHDTTPPRIRGVTVNDSLSATVELTQMLDPTQRLAPTAASVHLLPDSAPVKVLSVLPAAVDDSLHRPRPAAKDTAARAPPQVPGPKRQVAPPARPTLSAKLVVRVAQPWRPEARYAVELRGVRNVSGVAGDARGTLTIAKRVPRDTLSAPGDTLAPPEEAEPPGPRDEP